MDHMSDVFGSSRDFNFFGISSAEMLLNHRKIILSESEHFMVTVSMDLSLNNSDEYYTSTLFSTRAYMNAKECL